MKGLFWKVDLAVESSSGKPGLTPDPVSASVEEEGRGRLGWGSKWCRKCPSSCLQPILLVFPNILAPAFCCPLLPGTSRISELSERDRYENNYPSWNKIRAVREIQMVNRLNDFSWSGSGI